MHRALLLDEILKEVVGWMSLLDASQLDRQKSLKAFTLTCRAFSEPALDNIWRGPVKMSALIRIMPEVYRTWVEDGNNDQIVSSIVQVQLIMLSETSARNVSSTSQPSLHC